MSYLSFELDRPVSERHKTEVWSVVSASSGVKLGEIRWFAAWRQYTFMPERDTVFNPDCLGEIANRASELTRSHRAAKKLERSGR